MLRDDARSGRSELAIVDDDRRVSYGELDDTVNRIAGNLARHGIGRGDRVAIVLGNQSAFIEVSFACARLGAIQVPINIRQRKPEIEYVLGHSGAVAIVYEAELHDQIPDRYSYQTYAFNSRWGVQSLAQHPTRRSCSLADRLRNSQCTRMSPIASSTRQALPDGPKAPSSPITA